MTTFVLIPGFWLGAWSWRDVAADLRGRGHEVHALSLTGMGERAHLAGPGTDLDTHVTDTLNLFRYEELHDVVLVGHSYAGAVVTPSVADRAPERIAKLVFVDTGPLPEGMSQADFTTDGEPTGEVAEVVPAPPWEQVVPGHAERLTRLSVPQPVATATSPVHYTGAWEKLPRLFVMSSFTEADVKGMAGTVPAFQHMSGEFRELPGSHWPMIDQPTELAAILHDAA
ncbi:alpha/beta hydrolase [Actinoplanes sp. NBRC 103695]|uniref:alpha/beta fold hydrolase n=1 Tax=Actinoplanes sp. NBRC 103695 TaxID=3032202 RepID=UPI0024A35857|nr:alpha/beta hydrolase [Actinoplanes sp. NBRC 103695]GLY93129.1 esterase [Actinoplanes sp. NBRC 103695]